MNKFHFILFQFFAVTDCNGILILVFNLMWDTTDIQTTRY